MSVYNGSNDIAFTEKSFSGFPFYVDVPYKAGFLIPQRLGARSLEDTAVRATAKHIGDLTTRTLEGVPWHLAEKVYRNSHHITNASLRETLQAQDTSIPFLVWKRFVTIYAQEAAEDDFPDLKAKITIPYSLPDGLETGTAWLTQLSVQTSLLNFEDMYGLSRLPSLAILLLNSNVNLYKAFASEVDDRLISNWARSAQDGGFPNLRIISFQGSQHLTINCMDHLRSFCALQLVQFDGCTQLSPKTSSDASIVANIPGWHKVQTQIEEDRKLELASHGDLRPAKSWPHLKKQVRWSQWHKEELRRLQLEDPTDKSIGEDDCKKPILSLRCGSAASMSESLLSYRRDAGSSTEYKSNDAGKMQSVRHGETGSTKRQIKKQKLHGFEDFEAMLSNT